MRAFITGASGFVGRHLQGHLQAEGDAVLGSAQKLEPNDDAASIVEWDLNGSPSAACQSRVEEFAPDVLFHLAAISIPRDCGDVEPTSAAQRVNVDAVGRIIDFAASLPRPPRIVFMSSSHVYAAVAIDAPVVAETYPIGPRSAYGKTKWAAEELCRRAATDLHAAGKSAPEIVIIRSFTMSGPGQDGRLMLAEWADQFVAGGTEPIRVVSLDAVIDFLNVRDGVRALRAIALRGAAGSVYNLGSGVPRTSGEILRLMQEQTGDRRPVIELRPGRRSDPIADVTRLRTAADWSPQIPPEQTVADVLADRRNRIS